MNHHYLLLCLFGTSSWFVADTISHIAIIGGHLAKPHQFPYQVSLQVDNFNTYGHYCGGSIIGNRFILTAAHCLFVNGSIDYSPLEVVAGTENPQRPHNKFVMTVPVKKIYIPAEYDVNRPLYTTGDIAVLVLNNSLGLSPTNQNLIKLKLSHNKNENYVGKSTVATGFGWNWVELVGDEQRGGNNNTRLRFIKVDTLADCPITNIHETQICARSKQHDPQKPTGICIGDSGGPLTHKDTIIGVISLGPKTCSEAEEATIYTRVSHFIEFIHNAVQDRRHKDIRTYQLIP